MVLKEAASLSVAELGDRVGLSSTLMEAHPACSGPAVSDLRMRGTGRPERSLRLGISVFVSVEKSDPSEAVAEEVPRTRFSAMPEVMDFYPQWPGDVDTCPPSWSRTLQNYEGLLQEADCGPCR